MTARLTGGPTRGWRALPECPVCGEAVQRAAFAANGGSCTPCRGALPPDPDRLEMIEWQRLVADRGRQERAAAAAREAKRRARRG